MASQSHSESEILDSKTKEDSDSEDESKYLKFKDRYLRKKYRVTSLNIYKINNSNQALEDLEFEETNDKTLDNFEYEVKSLNLFILNPGLNHLAKKIFEFCDPKSLKRCRNVNSLFRYFIDTHNIYLNKQFDLLKSDVESFKILHGLHALKLEKDRIDLSNCQKWTEIVNTFAQENGQNMKKFIKFMIEYYGHAGTHRIHPFHYIFID